MLKNRCNIEAYTSALFVLYIICLLKITVIRSGIHVEHLFSGKLNLIPFIDLIMVRNNGLWIFLYLLVGNIIWFIPLGFLIPIICRKIGLKKIVIYGLLLSISIESLQFVLGTGITEIDDLILNTLGVCFGYLIYRIWHRISNNSPRGVP